MSASTVTAGYPVHRVAQFSKWTNQFGVQFTDWVSPCGVQDTSTGHPDEHGRGGPFGTAGTARRLELCPSCFPSRIATGPGAYFPDPVEVPRRETAS